MPILSDYARGKKLNYFIKSIPEQAKILEIGCADGWLGNYLKTHGWHNYVGLDIKPPADIVGNIKDWERIGIKKNSFDVIIAFEVIEHVDCLQECHEILKPGGQLMLTSPVPHFDWILKILEWLGLNQKRITPHDNLIYLRKVPLFEDKKIKIVGFLSQWGIFTK